MTFINMLRDESGASAAEYALILAIVGSGIALAAVTLGDTIAQALGGAGEKICNPPAGEDGEAINLCEEAA
jgi:pilus assembly protein Flp/PilA